MGVQGERSFHIFYQLLRGASAAERTAWRLPAGPSDIRYLSGAGAVHAIDNVDDAAAFAVVRAAMTAVKIPKDLQDRMFAIVSAVLWLGNVQFVATSDDETGVVKDAAFETACALLEVPEATLEFALTHRKVQAGNEAYELPLNMGNALDARDALAKVRCSAMVAWAVCACSEVGCPLNCVAGHQHGCGAATCVRSSRGLGQSLFEEAGHAHFVALAGASVVCIGLLTVLDNTAAGDGPLFACLASWHHQSKLSSVSIARIITPRCNYQHLTCKAPPLASPADAIVRSSTPQCMSHNQTL